MLAEHAPRVLIADDDNDMRLYCVKALQSEGDGPCRLRMLLVRSRCSSGGWSMYFSPIFSLGRRTSHSEESTSQAFAHGGWLDGTRAKGSSPSVCGIHPNVWS